MTVGSEDRLISVYSADQVRKLTGLSARQLSYWAQTDFFRPAHELESPERFGRVYSFNDLVGLRVIAVMRKKVPLQELRRVGEWLNEHRDRWAGRTFWVGGRRVYWEDPTGIRVGTMQPLQAEMPIEMDAVTADMRRAISDAQNRPADEYGQVERRRYTMGHKPILAGTRIPTLAVWELHVSGCSADRIRREFPRLTDRRR